VFSWPQNVHDERSTYASYIKVRWLIYLINTAEYLCHIALGTYGYTRVSATLGKYTYKYWAFHTSKMDREDLVGTSEKLRQRNYVRHTKILRPSYSPSMQGSNFPTPIFLEAHSSFYSLFQARMKHLNMKRTVPPTRYSRTR
jgi:hypothetical protein